jgi:tRNA nucleotidyltransferase (CCA-adding enzyme)
MQVYLVGGAVRDELLGLPVGERDWVVVGATPQQMEQLGYRAVGREFPVFLHPQTHEEHALARLERKTAPGYRGFVTEFSPEVTLEQDLQRRDLTINAMARVATPAGGADGAGDLIDPYGGRADLERRQLRHVSPAFAEDPVRVLRVARFAARFASLGFEVAAETRAMMQAMAANGEVGALVPERVWREMERAMGEPTPEAFLDTLDGCGALPIVLPELRWESEDRDALRAAARLTNDASVRFAALVAGSGLSEIESLCKRLRTPARFSELALLCARLRQRLAGASTLDAADLLDLLDEADALRRPERFERLLLSAAARGAAVPPTVNNTMNSAGPFDRLRAAAAAAAAVTLDPARMRELAGPEIAAALRAARIERLAAS